MVSARQHQTVDDDCWSVRSLPVVASSRRIGDLHRDANGWYSLAQSEYVVLRVTNPDVRTSESSQGGSMVDQADDVTREDAQTGTSNENHPSWLPELPRFSVFTLDY